MWNPGCQGRGEHDSTSHTHSSSDTGSWRLKFITFHGVELRVIRIRHAALLGLVCAHCRGKETLGSGAVPAKLPPPPSPAQAGQGSQSIKNKFKKKKKIPFPPPVTFNYFNLSHEWEGHSAEAVELFHTFSAQPGKLNCDTGQHLFCLCLLDRLSCWFFPFLIFFSLFDWSLGFFPVLLRCCSVVPVSVSISWSELAQPREPGLEITPITTGGREKLWILPEVQCGVKFSY